MTTPSTARDSERGMSLVELMIAAMISIVLVGAIYSTLSSQNRHRQLLTERSLAVSALTNNLERARTLAQGDIAALDGVGFDVLGLNGQPGGLQPIEGDADGLPGQITVTLDKKSGTAELYRVTGTVRWRGVGGDRVVLLQTLIGERR